MMSLLAVVPVVAPVALPAPGAGEAPGFSSSLRARMGTHSVERMPRLWTLLLLLNRWSLIALPLSTPSPWVSTWLITVREAWILPAAPSAEGWPLLGAPAAVAEP